MKVICKNNEGYEGYMTLDKEYEVTHFYTFEGTTFFEITTDHPTFTSGAYKASRFACVRSNKG